MALIVLYFLHSTLVLAFYIDVVLTISIALYGIVIQVELSKVWQYKHEST